MHINSKITYFYPKSVDLCTPSNKDKRKFFNNSSFCDLIKSGGIAVVEAGVNAYFNGKIFQAVNAHLPLFPPLSYNKRSTIEYATKGINAFVTYFNTPKLEKAEPLPKWELAPSLEFLDEQNLECDALFDSLFDMAFIKAPNGNETPVKTWDPVESIETTESEKERTERVNRSIKEFYERPKDTTGQYTLLSKDALRNLIKEAKDIALHWKNRLIAQRREILDLLNPSELPHLQKLTLDNLRNLLLGNQLLELCQRLKLKPEDLQLLLMAFMHYTADYGRFNQLNRVLFHFENVCKHEKSGDVKKYQISLSQLAHELKARRQFKFSKTPTRLLYRLVFIEWLANITLWEKQVKIISILLAGKDPDAAIEMIMALGKTDCVCPIAFSHEADGDQIVFGVFARELAETNTRIIAPRSLTVYGQDTNTIDEHRYLGRMPENYRAKYVVMQRAREERETIHIVDTDAQSLELNLLDLCYARSFRDTSSSIEELQRILSLMRTKGKLIGDEIHHYATPKRQLRYSLGKRLQLEKKYVLTLERCYKSLMKDPDTYNLMRENELEKLSLKTYTTQVAPEAAKRLSYLKVYDLNTDEERNLFVDYVCGRSKEIPSFIRKHPKFDEIALIKGFFEVLFFSALSDPLNSFNGVGISFGFSLQNPKDEKAIPYHGIDNPIEPCTIQLPYEALAKTGLTYFHKGLKDFQIDKLVSYLNESAIKEIKLKPKPREKTAAGKFLKKVQDTIQINPKAIFLNIRQFVNKQIHYYTRNMEANFHNFASMFKSLYAESGTPYNDGCYHRHIKMLWDPGTIGEALHIFNQKCPQENIDIIKASKPHAILDTVLDKYFAPGKDFSMFIDGGSYLKMSNEAVVDQMIEYCKKNRKDIEGIVFVKKVDGKDLLVCREFSEDSYNDVPFDQCKLSPEKRLTFLDHVHAFGTNVPQSGSMINLVRNQPFYHLLQEVFRLRPDKFKELYFAENLKGISQESTTKQIHLAMIEDVANIMFPEMDLISIRSVLTKLIQVEANQAAEDNYQSFKQKLHDVIRRAILDKMIFAPSVSKLIKIFTSFIDFLIPKVEIDPIKLFAYIKTMKNTDQVLTKYREYLYKVIENSWWFSKAEKKEISDELDELMDPKKRPPMPPETAVYTDGDDIVNFSDSLGKETMTFAENNSQSENTTEAQFQTLTNSLTPDSGNELFEETPWPTTVNPRSLEWLKYQNTPTIVERLKNRYRLKEMPAFYNLPEILKTSPNKDLQHIAEAFDKRIWLTNNFLPREGKKLLSTPITPGSREQCDIYEIIVHYQDNKILAVGCITQKEYADLKEMLEKNPPEANGVKTMLYNLYTRAPIGGDCMDVDALKMNPDFQKLEAQLRFLNGEVDYPELKEALYECLKDINSFSILGAQAYLNRRTQLLTGTELESVIAKIHKIPLDERL